MYQKIFVFLEFLDDAVIFVSSLAIFQSLTLSLMLHFLIIFVKVFDLRE